MNFRILPFLLSCALIPTLQAQDLAPELVPMAAKYKADLEALDTQKDTEAVRVSQAYIAALAEAEAKATAGGDLKGLAAIGQERDDAKNGALPEKIPADLPKGLHGARKSCFEALARVAKDFTTREDRVRSDYVRSLATLDLRARNNAVLAAQIASEKERAVHDITPTSPAGILTSFLWVMGSDIWEFAPNGKLIQHRPSPPAWPGKTWKLAANRKGVECVFDNGKTGTYPFINGRLYHWDKTMGEFHREPLPLK
jgi:hypothetical protein